MYHLITYLLLLIFIHFRYDQSLLGVMLCITAISVLLVNFFVSNTHCKTKSNVKITKS